MSTNAKIITAVVVAVIVIGAGVWYWSSSGNSGMANNTVGYGNQNPPTSNNVTSAVTTTTSSSPAVMPQGDSNQAIQQDMTSADAQMKGFSSDSASVDQSMNDQPVQQGQ